MKKKVLISALILAVAVQCYSISTAATNPKSTQLSIAIKKYKAENYTGCLQDTERIVKNDPSNPVAYYYMAMSYAQAGKQSEAIEAYSKVLTLKPSATLYEYASLGKLCLESPDKCANMAPSIELEQMVKNISGENLSKEVKKSLQQKRLDLIKQEINNEKDLDTYQLKNFKDYSNKKSKADSDSEKKISQESKQPTNDEIVAALKVLNQAGLTNITNPLTQINNPMMPAQNAEMSQLNMLLGNGGAQQNNNNAMMNMIPFMLAQKTKEGEANYAPQIMQTMMMNSMMPDFNFNLDNNK